MLEKPRPKRLTQNRVVSLFTFIRGSDQANFQKSG